MELVKLSEATSATLGDDGVLTITPAHRGVFWLEPAEVAALRELLAPDAVQLRRYHNALAAIAKGGIKHRDAAGIARRTLGWNGRTKPERKADAAD